MSKKDSYSVSLRGNFQRIKKDGTCSLYLRLLINRQKQDLPINLSWPADLIDNKNGFIKPRKRIDPDWQDNQLIIQNEINKINEIFKLYRIQDMPLTLERLNKELRSFDKRGCFLAFMRHKIQERFDINDIDTRTYQNHLSAMKTLHNSIEDAQLPFIAVTDDLFNHYKKHCLKKENHSDETIRGRIAIFKKYLRLARKAGISIDPNVLDYKIGERNRRLVWLTPEETKLLMNELSTGSLSQSEELSLRAFLFSCFTGLRASDLIRAHHNWITINNDLDFTMKKNSRTRPKRIVLPLTEIAKSFIPTHRGFFFNIEEQTINEKIKLIASRLRINKHLTIHIARHTFGSNFIANGGEVTVLQQLMGHSRIKDTMIYVHIHYDLKRRQMNDVFAKFVA